MKYIFLVFSIFAARALVLIHSDVDLCVVSPDSASVACILGNGDGLITSGLDGSGLTTVVTGAEVAGPIGQVSWAGNTRLVFRGDCETVARQELFWVPADGSASFQRINGDLAGAGADVEDDWQVSPDAAWVIYRADRDTVGQTEIYSVPSDGSLAEAELNPAMPGAGDVRSPFTVTTRVFFVATDSGSNADHLFSAPIDGSAAAIDLSTLVDGLEDVEAFALSPNQALVAFDIENPLVTGNRGIHVAYANGSAGATQLSNTHGTAIFWIGQTTVVWCGATAWAAPADASSAAVRQSQSAGIDTCRISGSYLVWSGDQETPGITELWSVVVSTGGSSPTPVKLNGVMTADSDIWDFLITGSGTVVYNADQVSNNFDQTFYGPIAGPASSFAQVDPSFVGRCQDEDWSLSPNGQWLVCVAFSDLYRSTSIPGTMQLVENTISGFSLAPDSNNMVYVTSAGPAYSLAQTDPPSPTTTAGGTSAASRLLSLPCLRFDNIEAFAVSLMNCGLSHILNMPCMRFDNIEVFAMSLVVNCGGLPSWPWFDDNPFFY